MRPERRARSGVDGGLQVASAQLKPYTLPTPDGEEAILRNVDIARIQDERSRECIRLLLNLIESLTVDLRKSQAENLYLREQLNRRKGGAGKPDQPKDTAGPKPQSSEKERAETRQRTRRGKLERVRIDREEVLRLDRTSLPPDAQFKGYDDVVVQELRIGTDNVKFRKEKYYAPSTGQNLSGVAPRRLPRRIRSESEEHVPAVLSFVQYDGAKDCGFAGKLRHRDFQRPDPGVADGRIPRDTGGKAGYCGSRPDQQPDGPPLWGTQRRAAYG
jgi:hypothetical protein